MSHGRDSTPIVNNGEIMLKASGFWRREREEGGERSEACERGKNWDGFRASECDARGSTRKRRKGREG